MRRTLTPILLSTVLFLATGVLPLHAANPAHLWSQRFGGANSEFSNSVAVDGSGNILVTGRFSGSVDFGGGNLSSSGGSTDIFLAKYNASGAHQWSKRFGSSATDVGNAVAVDASGNVIMAGQFDGTVDFGGGALVGAGSNEIFVAKYNASGVHQWSQRFGSTGPDAANGIAVDGSGNVVVTGYFQATVDFGGGGLISAGSYDIFLAKYNASGVHQWSKRFGGTTDEFGEAVEIDGSSNPFVTGRFIGTVDFGGGGLVSAGSNDIFLAKYNASGVHQWSQRFGSTGFDVGEAVAVDGSGNAVVTGSFQATVDFGGGGLVSAGGSDIFIARYSASGIHQWSQRFGASSGDVGSDVTIDGSGDIILTGEFEGTVGVGGPGLVGAGLRDIFLASYNANGDHQWSQRFGSTGMDRGFGVGVDGLGNVVFTGQFEGTVDFGGGSLVSAGGADIVLAKYLLAESLITSILDIGNDQGRRVRIAFGRSGFDIASSPTPVVSYEAYRRNDALVAAISGQGLTKRELFDLGWVFAGEIPAHGASDYVMDAPTDADSTIADGLHYSVFFIRAATAAPTVFYDSAIDSGYSLDNLAPGVPLNLVYETGDLTWDEPSAADFDFFSVYGSNTSSFASATLVDYTVAPTMDVSSEDYEYYFVTATDFSGNEGAPAVINTLSGVGGTPGSFVLSIAAYPNPFNPQTTIRYTVPDKGHVTIEVFDARGAHIATLFSGERAAGAHSAEWDGRAASGALVGSGVYFGRIEHDGVTRSRKMLLLK